MTIADRHCDAGELLVRARDPSAYATHAFAGVLARFGTLGLAPGDLAELLERHFEGGAALMGGVGKEQCGDPEDVADILELLLEHRSGDARDTVGLAHALAVACLGQNHLWQDMGLPHREALSALIGAHFTALAVKNTGNMKWKKFFYKQLCDRAGVNLCKAPSCGVCSDYRNCFGPEHGPAAATLPD